jgi:hypothetical protein
VPKGKRKKEKKAAYSPLPTPEKRPNWVGPPTFEGGLLSWRFSSADAGGPWAWPKIPDADLKRIMERLAAFETMPHGREIKAVRSIVSVVKLSQPARERLSALQRDDIDSLFGWRISGLERLWCVQYSGMMCVLWWDPQHEVYSVPKRHT